MDYQSEFARIKEERRRLERTLRAELKDVAKRAPDEKVLFGKPLRALEGRLLVQFFGVHVWGTATPASPSSQNGQTRMRGSSLLGCSSAWPRPLAETGSGGAGTSRPPQRSRTATSCKSFQTTFPSLGGRNQRELLTLAEALDRMASGDYGRAADVLSQRFKAIEMALHDGEWPRASHVEILPQTGRPLLSRQEEALVARDIREEVRIKAHLDKAGVVAGRGAAGVCMGPPHDRQPTDKTKDKGSGKHGKGKDRASDRETDRKEDDKKHERKK